MKCFLNVLPQHACLSFLLHYLFEEMEREEKQQKAVIKKTRECASTELSSVTNTLKHKLLGLKKPGHAIGKASIGARVGTITNRLAPGLVHTLFPAHFGGCGGLLLKLQLLLCLNDKFLHFRIVHC